jgi:ankyrin repeat protein
MPIFFQHLISRSLSMTLRKAIAHFFNEARKPSPERVSKTLLNLCRQNHLSRVETSKAVHLIWDAKNLDEKTYGPSGEARTLLNLAARHNHRDIVTALIEHGAGCDEKNDAGVTPLMSAAEGGHIGMVRLLIAYGADVDKRDRSGMTPLVVALERARSDVDYPIADMVQMLAGKGPGLDAKDSRGQTPLMSAASHGWSLAASILIDRGASPDQQDKYGTTVLMLAVMQGHKDIVQLLADKGADVNKQDSHSQTALSYAAHAGRDDIARILHEKGADFDAALQLAKKRGWADRAVEKLESFRQKFKANGADAPDAAPVETAAPAAVAKPRVPK